MRYDRKRDERGGRVTCSKGPQVRLELWAAAARTLNVGRALYKLSYCGGSLLVFS